MKSFNSCSVNRNFLRIAHPWKKMLFHFSAGTGSSAAKIDCSQSPIFSSHRQERELTPRGRDIPRWPLLTQSAYGKTGDSEQFTAKMFPKFTQVSLLSGLCGYRKLHREVKMSSTIGDENAYRWRNLLGFIKFRFHTVSQQECVFDNRNCNSCFHSTLQHDCFQS